MDNRSNVRILLAERRGITDAGGLCSYHSLNFAGYRLEGREPFGEVAAFNEDFLAPEKGTEIRITSPLEILLIPVIGALEVKFRSVQDALYVSSGEALHIRGLPGNSFTLTNPYPGRQVSFIHIWLSAGSNAFEKLHYTVAKFNINDKNRLLPVSVSASAKTNVFISKMDLRHKEYYTCREGRDLFAFTVEGAFDFHDRLIQQKDGLILHKCSSEIEFEALSEDAILLLIETES